MKDALIFLESLVVSVSIGGGVLLEYAYGYSWAANIVIVWIWFVFIVEAIALLDQNYTALEIHNRKSKIRIRLFTILWVINVLILAACGWFSSCIALMLISILRHGKLAHDKERRKKESKEYDADEDSEEA